LAPAPDVAASLVARGRRDRRAGGRGSRRGGDPGPAPGIPGAGAPEPHRHQGRGRCEPTPVREPTRRGRATPGSLVVAAPGRGAAGRRQPGAGSHPQGAPAVRRRSALARSAAPALVLGLVAAAAPVVAQPSEARVAVIIGNNVGLAGEDALSYAEEDAERFRE